MIVVHASMPIDPDSRDEALSLAADLAEASRGEEGVVDYRMTTDVEDPNVLRVFERYEDEAALAAHGETEHFQRFQAGIADLLGGVPEITRFEVESAEAVDL